MRGSKTETNLSKKWSSYWQNSTLCDRSGVGWKLGWGETWILWINGATIKRGKGKFLNFGRVSKRGGSISHKCRSITFSDGIKYENLIVQIHNFIIENDTLREKCPNTELFLVRIFLYSVRIHFMQWHSQSKVYHVSCTW